MAYCRLFDWIAWWALGTVASRILIVWIFNNTGKSVLAAALYHATMNLAWQMFPVHGSNFDPRVNGIVTALAAFVVAAIWGPRTLTRRKLEMARSQ